MRFLRSLVSHLTSRRHYARVHDVQVKLVRGGAPSSATPKFRGEEELPRFKGEEGLHTTMERNVFNSPLSLHGTNPITGFMRTGYCEAPKSDFGNHSVAGIVSKEFLDFSAARGNDLRQAGLTDGCKWCLCVSRWKEAFDARNGDTDKIVPKVVLKATNQRALEGAQFEDLKKFAVDAEEGGK